MAWGWLSILLTPPTLSVCFSTTTPTPDDLGAGITRQQLKFGHMAAPSQWSSGLWLSLSFTCTAQCWEDRAQVMRDILLKQDFPPHVQL